MDKQKKLMIVLLVIGLIMAFVWVPVMRGSGAKKSKKNMGRAVSGGLSAGSSRDLIALGQSNERKKAKTFYADWGRNPFILSGSPKASVLEGIMWDANFPKAIINGNIFGVGDETGS